MNHQLILQFCRRFKVNKIKNIINSISTTMNLYKSLFKFCIKNINFTTKTLIDFQLNNNGITFLPDRIF